MTKRAVIYARVSGDDVREGKEGRNLAEQIKMGREYAQGKGYSIAAELPEDDRGASGASMDLPQLNRVFAMAQAGEFDVLVVREMDRLSRRLAKQLIIEEELKRAGVEIEYVLATYADNPEGNLSKQIKAVVSEYERLKIAERMTRGRRVKAKTGSIVSHGHAPYGYDIKYICTPDGQRLKSEFTINPKESKTVLRIFTRYAEGASIRSITKELTSHGIPTPADGYPVKSYHKLNKRGVWGRSTIYSILHNDCYTGSWFYGKRSPKSPNSKTMVNNDRETWIRVEIPAIIPPDLWETTQRLIGTNKSRGGNNVKHDYLLRGRVICEDCRGHLTATSCTPRGITYHYYVCRYPPVGKKHGEYSYRADWADKTVWEWAKHLLLDPQAIKEGLATYRREQEKSAEPTTQHINTIEGLLIEKREGLKRLLDLYLAGDFEKEILTEKKTDLEKTISELEKERAALVASLAEQSITAEQEKTLLDFTREIGKGLEAAETNFQTRRGIIEALGVEVTFASTPEQKTIRIKCILGENCYALSPAIGDGLALVQLCRAGVLAGLQRYDARPLEAEFLGMVIRPVTPGR